MRRFDFFISLLLSGSLLNLNFQGTAKAAEPIDVKVTRQRTYAILPFENNSPEKQAPWLSRHLSEYLIYQFSHVKEMRLIERTSIDKVLKELNLGQSLYSQNSREIPEIGKVLGANFLVVGSYTLQGTPQNKSLTVNIRILQTETVEILTKSVFQTTDTLDNLPRIKEKISRYFSAQSLSTFQLKKPISADYHKGLEALEQKDFSQAERLLNSALQNNPEFAEGYLALGRLYKKKAKLENNLKYIPEAMAWAEQALKIKPDFVPATLFIINLLNSQNQKSEARQRFENAISLSPGNPKLISYGLFTQKKHMTLKEIEKQVEKWGGNLSQPDIQEALGNVLVIKSMARKEYLTPAVLYLKRAYQQRPHQDSILVNIAMAYWRNEQYDLSIETLKQIDKRAIKDPSNYMFMGHIAQLNGLAYRKDQQESEKTAKAKNAFLLAKSFFEYGHKKTNRTDFLPQIAQMHLELGQKVEAEKTLLKALDRPDADAAVYEASARIFAEQKNFETAIEILENTYKKFDDPSAYLVLSLPKYYYKTGQTKKSRQLLNEMIAKNQMKRFAYSHLLWLSAKEKDWQKIKELFDDYSQSLSPDEKPSKESLQWLQEADLQIRLKTEPQNSHIINDLGELALQKNDVKLARKRFKQALIYSPNQPEIHYNLGLTYLATEAYSQAIASFNQALKLQPDYPKAEYNLVVIDIKTNKIVKAQNKLKRLKAKYPDFEAFELLHQKIQR